MNLSTCRYRARTSRTIRVGCFVAVLGFVGSANPMLAGGVAIVSTTLSDNGDNDGFADTRETVNLRLTVQNTSDIPLYAVTIRLSLVAGAEACLTTDEVTVGALAVGEIRLTEPFVFTVGDIDRATLGMSPLDELSVTYNVHVTSLPVNQPAQPSAVTLDLDLDVSGGSGPTMVFESFENGLGLFEPQNLDATLNNLAAAEGSRCQYNDPDAPNSNTTPSSEYGLVCYPGNSPAHAAAIWWGLSGPETSPGGGRGFSGFHSLFFGVDLGFPQNWTTPMSVLEAVRTAAPINVGWSGTAPTLSFKHQISLTDDRSTIVQPGTSYDRGVVMAQLADSQGDPAGPWFRLEPYYNVYDSQNDPLVLNCGFDPTDDGSTEDDYYNPADPNRRYGPSSTCFPQYTYVFMGGTSNGFDAGAIGKADGPGLQGLWGIGTWVESKFDLSRYRGKRLRVRFLATVLKGGGPAVETWEDLFHWNPIAGDDGWWIDDVTISDTLTAAAVVVNDTKDNSGLPEGDLTDTDVDGIVDTCDNCAAASNPGQDDLDDDGLGDVCDPCPTSVDNFDLDADSVCGADDNCPLVANPTQSDADLDGFGSACDCSDLDAATHPGAEEINDGQDNQCPGDFGFGSVDEISGMLGFFDPGNPDLLSWPSQPGATRYRIARSESPDLATACTINPSDFPNFIDSAVPAANGGIFFYLVRADRPIPGSWGRDSSGQERAICGG